MSRLYTKTRTALKYFCLFAQKHCIIFVIKVNRFRRIYCRNHKTTDETKTILHSYNNRAAVFLPSNIRRKKSLHLDYFVIYFYRWIKR